LTSCRSAAAAAGAQLKSGEEDVVDPLLVLGHAGSLSSLADLADRGL